MASSSPPPFSSSPTEFMFTSSPVSDQSTWSDGSEKSATTASTCTTTSVLVDCNVPEDHFTRRLHELLLLVMRKRESEESKGHIKNDMGDDSDENGRCSSSPASCSSSARSYGVTTMDKDTTHHTPMALNTPDWTRSPPQYMHTHTTTTPPDTDTEITLSPLVFASPSSDSDSGSNTTCPSHTQTKPPLPTPLPLTGYSYRIIHRATSYRPPRLDHVLPPYMGVGLGTDQDMQPPPRKRPKILTRTSTHPRIRTELARAPASVRRAASLRSLSDTDATNEAGNEKENVPPEIIPTVPVTPTPYQCHLTAHTKILTTVKDDGRTVLNRTRRGPCRVPIIAPPLVLPPPPGDIPALVRVKRLLEREAELRAETGLRIEGADAGGAGSVWDWEGVGDELRGQVVQWFMEVVPPILGGQWSAGRHSHACARSVSLESEDRVGEEEEEDLGTGCGSSEGTRTCSTGSGSGSSRSCSTSSTSTTSTTTTTTTAIGLTPTPRIRFYSPSTSSTSSSTTIHAYTCSYTPPAQKSRPRSGYPSNLHEQLATSPETRFHAAYLFLRFFHAVSWGGGTSTLGAESESGKGLECGGGNGNGGSEKEKDMEKEKLVFGAELDQEGRVLVTWDVAVACLALSVKYHRDFLYPLLPVYAFEFQSLAPHGREQPLSYDDLEIAHRDVLCALDWRLGDTPQALLSELWSALPSLRRLLGRGDGDGDGEEDGDRNSEWNCAQRETWRVLFKAVVEPDVLRFPLSLLTAAAVLHGVCAVLVRRYEDAAPWYIYELCSAAAAADTGAIKARGVERRGRAVRAVKEVRREVEVLLGVSEEAMEECWLWLERVLG